MNAKILCCILNPLYTENIFGYGECVFSIYFWKGLACLVYKNWGMERYGGDTIHVNSYVYNTENTSYCHTGDDRADDIVAA
jgi:hypothetical protein